MRDNPPTSSSIPGPKGHFLTGSLPELQHDRLSFLMELAQKYGDVIQLRLGPETAVLALHPDDVQHVLQENYANYSKKTRVFESLKPLLGNGLLVSNGDFWLRQRRLMQPAFHRQQINSFSELMVRETQSMLESWEGTMRSGQAFNVQQEMMRLTLAIVTQALFGKRVSDANGTLGANIAILLADATFRFDRLLYPGLWAPTPHNLRFKAARREVDRVVYEVIASRRGHEDAQNDLLSMLIQAQDEATGLGMTDQQLRDEVVTLFLAGHETTAVALSWTFYLLSQHPEVETRLVQELDQVLGGRVPTLADLPGLVYTRQVLDESPCASIRQPGSPNAEAINEDVIGGYPIPAGTSLVLSQYATHRRPQFWPDPETFNPDRFSPEQSNGRPRYAYFPFGGGPRQCIGNIFALVESQLILAAILQRFRLELAPGCKVEPEPLVTLRPKNGLWMKIHNIEMLSKKGYHTQGPES